MTTSSITKTSTQNQASLPAVSFYDIPNDVLVLIFSRAVHSNTIPSLLLTNRQFYQLISGNIPFWTNLLENRFRGSFDPTQKNLNPIETYEDIVTLRNGIKSNLCEIRNIPVNGQILQMVVQSDLLFTLCRRHLYDQPITLSRYNIEIWDLKSEKRTKTLSAIAEAPNIYVDRIAIHKDTLYAALHPETREGIFSIAVFDRDSGKKLNSLDFSKGDTFLDKFEISIQNNLLYAYLIDSTTKSLILKIWDTNTELQQVQDKKLKLETEICCILPDNDRIFLGCQNGEIKIWNYNTEEAPIHFSSDPKKNPVLQIRIHKDTLFSSDRVGTVAWDLADRKEKYAIEDFCYFIHADMLFTLALPRAVKIWDTETGEELRTRDDPILAGLGVPQLSIHKSKFLVGGGSGVKIFDFGAPAQYEKKSNNSKSARGYAELLGYAVFKKDREKIIDCIDKFVAADPENKELIEILCEHTEGDSLSIYECLTGAPFDHRKSIQSAPFYLIENAVSEFIYKLKTDRNIELNLVEFDQHPVENSYESEFSETDEPSSDSGF